MCSIVLTHDVESAIGMSRMEQMADLEERYNFRSAWNLPLSQFKIDWNVVDELRRRGFEFSFYEKRCHPTGRFCFTAKDDLKGNLPQSFRSCVTDGLKGFSRNRRRCAALQEWISESLEQFRADVSPIRILLNRSREELTVYSHSFSRTW